MKKWLFFLAILAIIYLLGRWGQTRRSSHPFLVRLNQTISIIVWVLLIAYTISFIYWLVTEVF
jgi:hypothetical protein